MSELKDLARMISNKFRNASKSIVVFGDEAEEGLANYKKIGVTGRKVKMPNSKETRAALEPKTSRSSSPAETKMSSEERQARRREYTRQNQVPKDRFNRVREDNTNMKYGRPNDTDRLIFNKTKDMSNGKISPNKNKEADYSANVEAIKNAAGHKEVSKRLKIGGYADMSTKQMREAVHQHHAPNIEKDPAIMNYVVGNKYHTKAVDGLITASVVGSLFTSRGQLTNAQLYGQSPGPGNI